MFCPKCDVEIKEKMKFCINCGEKLDFESVEEKKQEVNAENVYNKETNDIKNEEMESTSGDESNDESKRMDQQSTSNLTVTDKIRNKGKEIWNQLSVFSKVLTIFVAISVLLELTALLSGKALSAFIAVVQIALFVVGWLMQKEKIKQNKKWLPYLLIALAVLLFIPFLSTFSSNGKSDGPNQSVISDEKIVSKELMWPDHKLAQLVPKPKSTFGYANWEHDDEISISIEKTSRVDYEDYKKACAEKSFTTVSSEGDTFHYVKNDGYRLELSYSEDKETMSITISDPLYMVGIEIDCVQNLIFSKYDLKILVDSREIGTLKHGNTDTFNVELEKGAHALEIQSADSSSVNGSIDFEVNQNSSDKYDVSCKNDVVKIEEAGKTNPPIDVSELGDKSYDDVKKLFTDAGFINVTTIEIVGLTFDEKDKSNKASDISINGKSDFTKDTIYYKDVEVVITYHTFSQKNYDEGLRKHLESTFPVENAKRAAVVAITNAIANDVFKKDGDTYDTSKFHSYADDSGNFYNYYVSANSWGTWTVKDEKSWHIDSLELEHALGNVYKLNLDVKFDGTNYLVSNVKGTYGRYENVQDINRRVSENDVYLKIPTNLIKTDRANTKLDKHRAWVNNQFSSWDGSNKDLNSLIKGNLNDEKSFKHTETTYIEIVNEKIRGTINKTIKSSNREARVEIGDLWLTTEFSAKNAFNATVKNTAFGIASFKDNTIILIAIE